MSAAMIFMLYGLISSSEKRANRYYVDYQKFYQNLVNGGFAIELGFILLKAQSNRPCETHGFQNAKNSAYFATACIMLKISIVRITIYW